MCIIYPTAKSTLIFKLFERLRKPAVGKECLLRTLPKILKMLLLLNALVSICYENKKEKIFTFKKFRFLPKNALKKFTKYTVLKSGFLLIDWRNYRQVKGSEWAWTAGRDFPEDHPDHWLRNTLPSWHTPTSSFLFVVLEPCPEKNFKNSRIS